MNRGGCGEGWNELVWERPEQASCVASRARTADGCLVTLEKRLIIDHGLVVGTTIDGHIVEETLRPGLEDGRRSN